MKKVLSVLMATLMFLTLLVPCALAANGPYPIDWDTITEEELENLETMALISLVDYDTSEIGYVYPQVFADVMPVSVKGIEYDEELNVLTLKNVKTDDILVLTAMGDDFKIYVEGYNEIGCIISSDLAWGCALEFIGEGVLEVNGDKKYPAAIEMDVSGTGFGSINFEHNVNAKLVAGVDPETKENYPVIAVYGSSASKSTSVFRLGDVVVKSEPDETEEFKVTTYEQKTVQTVDKYYGDGIYLEKNGKMYIAEPCSEEGNTYNVAEVAFDKVLNNYLILPVASGSENIAIDSYTRLDTAKIPELVLERDSSPVDLDVCIDNNGKECVFIDYSDDLSEIEVYQVIEHEAYGTLALLYSPSSAYKELKVKGVTTVYDHYNYSSEIIINEFASTVPQKVTLKKAENAYGGVKVTWNEVSGAFRYKVYRSTYNASTKKWSKWSTLGYAGNGSYLDKTAKTGVKYKYTVRAENRVGLGGYDKTGVSTTYIAAPTVKIANASNGIKVSWNKISGATGYKIYRSQYANGKWSGWKTMGTAKATKSSWTDKSVKSGVAYKYTVRTISNKLASGYKASSAIRFLSVPTVKIQNASTGVKVSWNQIAGAKNYIIYRSEYNASTKKWSGWKNLGTVGAVTSHIDTTASSGVYYKYTVRAVNGGSKGSYVASAQLLYLAQPTTKIANASNGIKVSWNKVSGATGYTVYRSTYSNGKWSGWKNMGTAKATKASWTDKSVKEGVQYKYTVRAVNGKVKSTYKATAGLVRLQQPTVKAIIENETVKVSWNKISGAKSYRVYRSELVDGKWTSWANLGSQTTLSFVDKTVVGGSTYRYTVRAVNGKSLSSYKASNSVTITKAEEPTTPTGNTETTNPAQ